jgi:hypothetical protein
VGHDSFLGLQASQCPAAAERGCSAPGYAMPNGDDATWVRVCASIDGFRTRYGRWPTRVRLFAGALENLRDHVLTPAGFEVVIGIVQLVADDQAPMVADGCNRRVV